MAHKLSRLIQLAQATPWAILPEKLAQIRSVLLRSDERVDADNLDVAMKAAEDRDRVRMSGTTAVLRVFGTIAQRMNLCMVESGGTSTEVLKTEIAVAVADPDVSQIVLHIDSPGGSVFGVPELHAAILKGRAQKSIHAMIDPFAGSAAYYIASAASEIVITPSGEAGSIGVFCMHVDQSEFDKQMGIDVTLISAGKFKVEANPFAPLSEEARAKIQEDVTAFFTTFVRDVAKGRGVTTAVVRKDFGEGRMLLAVDALAAGMVDRIEPFDQMLKRISGGNKPRRSAAVHRERFELASKYL